MDSRLRGNDGNCVSTVIPAQAGMMQSTPIRLSLPTVIPAQAGMMQSTPIRLSLPTIIPAQAGMMQSTPIRLSLPTVIPAQAGMMQSTPIRLSLPTVIPVQAGMRRSTPIRLSLLTVIPAKAGIHAAFAEDECDRRCDSPAWAGIAGTAASNPITMPSNASGQGRAGPVARGISDQVRRYYFPFQVFFVLAYISVKPLFYVVFSWIFSITR